MEISPPVVASRIPSLRVLVSLQSTGTEIDAPDKETDGAEVGDGVAGRGSDGVRRGDVIAAGVSGVGAVTGMAPLK